MSPVSPRSTEIKKSSSVHTPTRKDMSKHCLHLVSKEGFSKLYGLESYTIDI